MIVAAYGTPNRSFHGVYAELDDGSYVTVSWCISSLLVDEFPSVWQEHDVWKSHWHLGPCRMLSTLSDDDD
jgi:hypothetical protein